MWRCSPGPLMSNEMEGTKVTHSLHSKVECTPSRLRRILAKHDWFPRCDGMVDDIGIRCHIPLHIGLHFWNPACGDSQGLWQYFQRRLHVLPLMAEYTSILWAALSSDIAVIERYENGIDCLTQSPGLKGHLSERLMIYIIQNEPQPGWRK